MTNENDMVLAVDIQVSECEYHPLWVKVTLKLHKNKEVNNELSKWQKNLSLVKG